MPRAREADLPATLEPQLAALVEAAPGGDGWLHEIKLDGYRLLCRVAEGGGGGPRSVRLITRNGKDWTDRFPGVAGAASALPVRSALLDGEAVVLDTAGRSDFQALQNALGRAGEPSSANLLYYAFDLLHLDGFDLTRSPLEERKALLQELLRDAPRELRYSEHVAGGGGAFHREACRLGLEGIVSKRSGSPYSAGRGRDWRKAKCVRRQEMVVVGWTEPTGSRPELGSLVLGVHDDEGELVYAGRVGTGFSERTLRDLRRRLDPLALDDPPVRGAPRSARGREIHWVRPELVAEVTFTEWTADGAVRHPSFQGLREDKPASEVVREEPDEGPADGAAGSDGGPSGEAARPAGPSGTVSGTVRIGGVVFTSPDRVLYPGAGVTKEQVGRYWQAVAQHALPLLSDRPLTLYRCPNGIAGECFFQKHANDTVPEAVPRVTVPERSGEPKPHPYLFVDGLPALLTLVQLGVLELHVWGARVDRLDRPDRVVMDLDPGPGVAWPEVVEAALALRAMLSELGLASWPRATGGKGLHVVVPLTRRHSWHEVRAFSRALSELMATAAPDRFVSQAGKSLRKGKIYVDWLRNGRNATAVTTFSPRARPGAPVSFPLSWQAVEEAEEVPFLALPEAAEVDWTARHPWRGFADARQSITGPMRRAVGID